ncbi:MAG TPA: RidA family protein [Trueperaceae bacterium]|nr:RidA family protein [Trueperaceae bacterium]
MRKNISSGAVWEKTVGYSRAVRVGNQVFVAGTTSVDKDGNIVGENDAYLQTKRVLEIIAAALNEAGASLKDVVRSRMFVTNIDDWQAIGKAHGEVFGDIRPAATMLEVSKLINPKMLVEIEVDAIIGINDED